MFKKLSEQLKANPRTIVFTEGTDARILEAADKLTAEGVLGVILLGKADEVKAAAKETGFNIDKCQIIDPEQYADIDAMVDEMVTLRKGKMTPEQVREALSKSNYFGTMLVKMGKADCLLGGATYSTADTVRPALQLIKTKPGNKIVSSCFIMVKGDKKLAMGDCAINIAPNEDELAEIAIETAKTAKIFGIDPKVAMLSYSTYGSGKGEMVTMVTLRKGKMTPEQVRDALSKSNYFGTMLVKMGKADCLLGGATYSTADTVRPALQLIKTKPGNKIVSSCFIMVKGDKKLAMGDCAINIAPNEDELAEIAIETAKTAKIFGIDPKVAMLSYSTYGSGKGEMVTLMANATKKVKEMAPDLDIDGELQFDAAVAPEVAKVKCAGSTVAGQANTFIFPEISAGNIGYKIAARLGEYEAIGPVLQGLNAPINDLSRGCNAQEVYKMALVTAALS